MLPKKNRLPASAFRNWEITHKSINFILKKKKNTLGNSRFGFVVSKNVCRRAVDRNRSKRICRKIIYEEIDNIHKGYDMLIIIRKNIADQIAGDFSKELVKLAHGI